MSTVFYSCGCFITRSMFGKREVLSIGHCSEHWYLFSEDKTLRQMAEELARLQMELLETGG